MNHEKTMTEKVISSSAEEISFLDVLIVLAKYKKQIIGFPLIIAIIAAAVSLVLPNAYKASTKLLPPQQAQSGASALLSQLGGVASMAAGVAGLKNPSDLYVGMLKSRTVADRLITRFELKKRYGTDSLQIARTNLAENTVIAAGKDGMISIEVESTDQNLVADLANAYVDELTRLTRSLAVTETSQRRLFFEKQLELAKDNLANVEIALKGALDTGGMISVDAESRAMLETAVRLKAQITAKEIQLDSMRAFVTARHQSYRVIQEELSSLRGELSKLEGGRSPSIPSGSAGGERGGFNNIKLMRDLKYYQMLYELLAKQYEMARLDEAKEPSLIQVLDKAIEPEHRFKPKRALIVLLSALIAGLMAVLWAFVTEAKRRSLAVPAGEARWQELKNHLRFRK